MKTLRSIVSSVGVLQESERESVFEPDELTGKQIATLQRIKL